MVSRKLIVPLNALRIRLASCRLVSYLPFADATVAQLVEQTIRNRQVSGSIPLGGLLQSIRVRSLRLHAQRIIVWYRSQFRGSA